MKYWLIKYSGQQILEVTQVPKDQPELDVGYAIILAETRERAEKKAKKKIYNLYCAQRKKEAKERHYAKGECACGRSQDRPNPDGGMFRTCSVCAARQPGYNQTHKQRKAAGTVGTGLRDEKARVISNLSRQRERKSEMRIEVLIEVRNKFWSTSTVKEFSTWLDENIQALTQKSTTTSTTKHPTLSQATG